MSRIELDNVRGYVVGGMMVCEKCITKQELEEVTPEDVLVEDEDALCFCDRCEHRL